ISPVEDLEKALVDAHVDLVILATPAQVAQELADRAIAAGVKAILNLAPVRLSHPDGVAVRHVCLSTELQVLSFHLAQKALNEQ
ncbi:MAG TPA: redox-sensing transcriptional repressor Rex, partial [Coriobacteriia bacterium]|nr:redox-sensing transcriptional repressor Rex [Coriobacteriia bacterium]